MKKQFMLLGLLFMAGSLFACGGEKTTTTKTTVTTTKNDGYIKDDVDIDLHGQDFIIMANEPLTADPRNDEYTGVNKDAKMDRIEYVEETYNCKVKYVNYPVGWGSQRDSWIIENSIAGTPAAHVFEISTSSVATLALNEAILPLDEFITKFGMDDLYIGFSRDYGKFLDKTYTYTDRVPFNDNVLFYNKDLLLENGIAEADLPANLWNRGEWTWSKFKEYATLFNGKFQSTDKYFMSGRNYDYAYQFINANGIAMVDSNLQCNIKAPESIEAMQYIADLYKIGDRVFKDDSPREDTCDPIFKDGKSVFQWGQTWYARNAGKLQNVEFALDAVPVPYNDKKAGVTKENFMETYSQVTVWGAATFVISSAYSIDNIPEGMENDLIHGETIFKIWNDLQDFSLDLDYIKELHIAENYKDSYTSMEAVEAHESIMMAHRLDLLYSLGDLAFGWGEDISTMMETAMREDSVGASAEEMFIKMDTHIKENMLGE